MLAITSQSLGLDRLLKEIRMFEFKYQGDEMKKYNQMGNTLMRFSASVFAISVAVLAVAQPRPVIAASQVEEVAKLKLGETRQLKKLDNKIVWSTVDTQRMFPAIAKTLSSKGLRPSNPSIEFGQPFSLQEVMERQRTKGVIDLPGGTTATSVAVLDSKFPGIGFTGFVPPDIHMAVGPNHIVQVVNSSVAFYNKKTGRLEFLQPLSATGFLPKAGNFVFDPRVVFDYDHNRFVVLALDVDFDNNKSFVQLAFSDDANPNGKWKVAKIDNELPDNNGNQRWGDYPNLTTSQNSVVMTFNHFPFGNGSVSGTVFVFRPTDNQLFAGNSGLFGMHMAKKLTAGPEAPVGLGVTFPFMFGNVPVNPTAQMIAVNDTVNPPALSGLNLDLPVFVRQVEGASTGGFMIDVLGDRLMDASQTNDSIAFAFTCNYGPDADGYTNNSLSQPDPRKTKVRWGEIKLNGWPLSANSPTVVQSGDLKGGNATALSYCLPAIAKNLEGSIAIVATQANADGVPSIVGAGRRPTDALGSMGQPTVFGTSANIFIDSPDGQSRWGDYAGIGLDPQLPDTFWGSHELFSDASLRWKTEIFKLRIKNSDVTVRNVLSVTPIFGTNVAGDITSFNTLGDSNVYSLNTEVVSGRGNYAGYEAVFDATALKDGARLNLAMSATANGVSGFIYAYNNITNSFDLLTSTRLKTTQTTYTQEFPQSYFAKYRNTTTGEMKLRFVALSTIQRRGTPPIQFRFDTDLGVLTINTQ
jgi:hypothetical protein